MESKDKSKKIDIKNGACSYFDDTINEIDILLDKKLFENISVRTFHTKLQQVQTIAY